jgi:hypothetical protein
MAFCVACAGEIATLRGYETGTFWDWRALAGARATSRDIAWNALEERDRATNSKGSCKQAVDVAQAGAPLTPSFAREGVADWCFHHEVHRRCSENLLARRL